MEGCHARHDATYRHSWGFEPIARDDVADRVLAKECVQTRQTCSVGNSPTRVKVRSPVARVASVEETKRMKPTDKAIFGMASESPGRNASEPSGGLDKK